MRTSAIQNLILRIITFVLLLISLIVMVTVKTTDVVTLTDEYNRVEVLHYRFRDWEAFRYVIAANVIGCLYSFIRIILELGGTIGAFYFYLSFILDQVMAYIVLSSSSAGIAYIMFMRDFFQIQGLYGVAEKKFLRYASASVSMEFLGFIVIAASAVMSAYTLFNYLCSPTISTVPTQGTPPPNIDNSQQGAA